MTILFFLKPSPYNQPPSGVPLWKDALRIRRDYLKKKKRKKKLQEEEETLLMMLVDILEDLEDE